MFADFARCVIGFAPQMSPPEQNSWELFLLLLIFTIERSQLPSGTEVTIGDFLRIEFADGESASVQVADLDEESVTLDANHALAGRDLNFELTLVAIQ
jgi:FKBP-type peptidyl-prolyl cis-trans isomerase 2